MKGARRVVIEVRPGEVRAAALGDDGPLAFRVMRDHEPSMIGGIYVGRVRAVRPEIKAAFVDIGTGEDGFLNIKKSQADRIAEGAALLVQVDRDPTPGKGPRLTLTVRGDGSDGTVENTGAPVPRLISAPWPPAGRFLSAWLGSDTREIITDDGDAASGLAACAETLRSGTGRMVVHTPQGRAAFDFAGIDEAFDAALSPHVALPGGGALAIAETAAMTTVDVNTGTAAEGRGTAMAVNLAAARAIPGEIMRRGIGGIIAVDFLNLSGARERAAIIAGLRESAAADPLKPEISDFLPFDVVLINRRREGPSLGETLFSRAMRPTAETVALNALAAICRRRGAGLGLRLRADAARALHGPLAGALKVAQARLGFQIRVERAMDDLDDEGFEIQEGGV